MQFNSNDSGSSLQSEINITPLVDVVLVLLIIFMVVVPLLLEGYDVDIPRASADKSAQLAESQLLLSIGSAGGRATSSQLVAAEHFGEALQAAVGAEPDP